MSSILYCLFTQSCGFEKAFGKPRLLLRTNALKETSEQCCDASRLIQNYITYGNRVLNCMFARVYNSYNTFFELHRYKLDEQNVILGISALHTRQY